MDPAAAATEVLRRKAKRVEGLLRDITRELATLADGGPDVYATLVVHDRDSAEQAAQLTRVAAAQHGAVDVVVLLRARKRRKPTTTPPGVKETNDAQCSTPAAPEAAADKPAVTERQVRGQPVQAAGGASRG